MAGKSLTPTSYAILGLLAVKPWTTYELAQQMERALGEFWPRAQSKLYDEPKKLVALGLARASSEKIGKRPRTVYTITDEGRQELEAWMPTPGAGPALEFELLIKVFFAEHGSKADLLTTIERVRQWTEEHLASTAGISRGYLEGTGPFPERLPWLILTGRFLDEYVHTVQRWAEWAVAVVEPLPDFHSKADPDWATLQDMAERHDADLRRAAQRRRGALTRASRPPQQVS
jgi:PadR family transcriptional regulator AphA